MAEGQRLPLRLTTVLAHQQLVQVLLRHMRRDRTLQIGRIGVDDEQIVAGIRRDMPRKGQIRQEIDSLRAQLLGHPREMGGEPVVILAGWRLSRTMAKVRIRVALDNRRRDLSHPIHHLRRPRPRPDQVAGDDDLIDGALLAQVVQHGIERHQIAVNVGKEGDPH